MLSVETKPCGNCNKAILATNILPHEAYCYRHTVICEKCNEPLDRGERESHDNKYHIHKYCSFCKELFEAVDLTHHMEECKKRPIPCEYCSTEVSYDEMKDHVGHCAMKGEKCGFCESMIDAPSFEAHVKECEQQFFKQAIEAETNEPDEEVKDADEKRQRRARNPKDKVINEKPRQSERKDEEEAKPPKPTKKVKKRGNKDKQRK